MKPATRSDITQWVFEGKQTLGCTHVIIVCDDFSYEDYPVQVMEDQDIEKEMKKYTFKNMQRIMEVYSMRMDLAEQIKEIRAYHPNHT